MSLRKISLATVWSPHSSCSMPFYRYQVLDHTKAVEGETPPKILIESVDIEEIKQFLNNKFGLKVS